MPDDPFAILQIPPTADGRAIDSAYWIRAGQLKAARSTRPDADYELDRLNWAYHLITTGEYDGSPRRAPSRRRRWLRGLKAPMLVALVAAGTALASLAYREEIADLSGESRQRAEQAADDVADWFRSLDATPVPENQTFVLANTGGVGAYLRSAPSYSAGGIAPLRDGAYLTALGEEATAEGETWMKVRDALGREGWVSSRWLTPLEENASP